MQTDVYHALLDQISHASLIIVQQTRQIIAANAKALEISGYSRSELIEQDIQKILPGYLSPSRAETNSLFSSGQTNSSAAKVETQELKDFNHNQQKVFVRTVNLNSREKHLLIVLDLVDVIQESSSPVLPGEFWHSLERLAAAGQAKDLDAAIQQVLVTCKELSGAGFALVYKMADNRPVLDLSASDSPDVVFPAQIDTQDLAPLGVLQMWKPGKRSTTKIHRFARQEKLSYLVSAPLGEAHALIGALVIAGKTSPSQSVMEIAAFTSVILTTLLEQHTWRANAEHELQSSEARLNSADTIEERISDGLILLITQPVNKTIEPGSRDHFGLQATRGERSADP